MQWCLEAHQESVESSRVSLHPSQEIINQCIYPLASQVSNNISTTMRNYGDYAANRQNAGNESDYWLFNAGEPSIQV